MPYDKPMGPKRWPNYNKKVFPPQVDGEERRPAVRLSLFSRLTANDLADYFQLFFSCSSMSAT